MAGSAIFCYVVYVVMSFRFICMFVYCVICVSFYFVLLSCMFRFIVHCCLFVNGVDLLSMAAHGRTCAG